MVDEKDLLPIGRVVRSHGVKGKIKVEYFGEDLGRFPAYRELFIKDAGGAPRAYEVLEVAEQPPRLILRLKGIERIEETAPLLGKEILVRKEDLPKLEEGEYFWFDILGMEVETEEGKKIGKVKEIFPTGANDVYVVEGSGEEIYLPATAEVIQSVDLKNRVIKIIWKEGLGDK